MSATVTQAPGIVSRVLDMLSGINPLVLLIGVLVAFAIYRGFKLTITINPKGAEPRNEGEPTRR